MVPIQSLGDSFVEILVTLSIVLVPGLVATALWAPFLAAVRVRSLFRSLPPSGSVLPSYLIVGVAASLPYVLGVAVVLVTVDPNGAGPATWSNALLNLTVLLFVAYAVGVPVVGTAVLPRAGVDWDPTGYGASTWLLLAGGGAWYALLFAVPLVLVSLLFALPGGY